MFSDRDRTTKTSLCGGHRCWARGSIRISRSISNTRINNAEFKNSSPRDGHQWESVQLGVAAAGSSATWATSGVRTSWAASARCVTTRTRASCCRQRRFYGNGWDPMAAARRRHPYNLSERLALRGEIAARYDHDNNSITISPRGFRPPAGFSQRQSGFIDGIATIGLTYSFGGHAAAADRPPPAPPPPPPPPPAA